MRRGGSWKETGETEDPGGGRSPGHKVGTEEERGEEGAEEGDVGKSERERQTILILKVREVGN